MDEKTREKVHALAKSMKELHLAASMEEALERAKEIILSSDDNSKAIKDLAEDIKHEVSKEAEIIDKASKLEEKFAEKIKSDIHKEVSDVKKSADFAKVSHTDLRSVAEKFDKDLKEHHIEKVDAKEATEDIEEIDCASKDARFIVDKADKVQKIVKKKQ